MGAQVGCCDRPGASAQGEQTIAAKEPSVGTSSVPKVEKAPDMVAPPAAISATDKSGGKTDDVFDIVLDKSAGDRLGIDVDHQDNLTLLIESINGGLMEAWNTKNPNKEVKPGDRVFQVNGLEGDVLQLVDECKKNQVLKMKIRRG
eukprot:gnl/TRDRNA2_/TRDRNA2_42486_c0_seq1.p1 gnl/TRDRNA2_/TRDRNA2_42486_c0~~gnl/TRDRNA2_/TRDRNA2_42486_c0_seq1.p1  ORF type:complete len:146 (+),score=44.10 gnl/TRDRNA2_/TRDRNA2_42486_c0_seq1:167-604(+)